MLPTWQRWVNDALLLAGVLASWGFIARYTQTYRWWRTDLGAHLVTFSACVGAFYTYFAVVLIWPGLPGKAIIRTVLFVALTAAMVWRWAIFEQVRRQTKRDKESER